jgi:hypothetical protein
MTVESTALHQDGLATRFLKWCRPFFADPRKDRSGLGDLVKFVPALLVFALTAMRANSLIRDGDTYWRIAAGRWMLAHHAILHSDPFSYTFAGHPWLTHEWVAELIMALTFWTGGWPAFDLLFGLAAGVAAFLLARHFLKYLEPIPAVVLQQLALFCIVPYLLLRPHSLAMPLLIAWTGALLSARDGKRAPPWTILILMLVWSNLHASLVVGLFLVAVFAAEDAIESGRSWPQAVRRWLPFGLGALLAAILTPQGIAGLIFPLNLISATAVLAAVNEFQSSEVTTVTPLEVLLLGSMFFCFVRPMRLPLGRVLLFLLLVHLALEHRRDIYILASVGLMVLARPIALALGPGAERAGQEKGVKPISSVAASSSALAVVLIAAARFVIPAIPVDSRVAPTNALAHVPAELAREPVFNDYSMGGYLIFRGIRPFIDGRGDMYGDSFVENYARIIRPDRRGIETTFAKCKVMWTILIPDNAANEILDMLPGWRILYKDEFAIVHVRNDLVAPEHT